MSENQKIRKISACFLSLMKKPLALRPEFLLQLREETYKMRLRQSANHSPKEENRYEGLSF